MEWMWEVWKKFIPLPSCCHCHVTCSTVSVRLLHYPSQILFLPCPQSVHWLRTLELHWKRIVIYCFMNTMNSDILLSSHTVFRLLYSMEVGIFRCRASVFFASENTVKWIWNVMRDELILAYFFFFLVFPWKIHFTLIHSVSISTLNFFHLFV